MKMKKVKYIEFVVHKHSVGEYKNFEWDYFMELLLRENNYYANSGKIVLQKSSLSWLLCASDVSLSGADIKECHSSSRVVLCKSPIWSNLPITSLQTTLPTHCQSCQFANDIATNPPTSTNSPAECIQPLDVTLSGPPAVLMIACN